MIGEDLSKIKFIHVNFAELTIFNSGNINIQSYVPLYPFNIPIILPLPDYWELPAIDIPQIAHYNEHILNLWSY